MLELFQPLYGIPIQSTVYFQNKSFPQLIRILISWHTLFATCYFVVKMISHQCATMGHGRCCHRSYPCPQHYIRNSFRFYFFFCAFIPGASGRSAGGINLSIPIGIFYFIKGSGYAITTLTSSYTQHIHPEIFSHYPELQPMNFTINSFYDNIRCTSQSFVDKPIIKVGTGFLVFVASNKIFLKISCF